MACALVRQLAEGLGAAHRHGIVHRDVKPENVMLLGTVGAPAGGATQVKLLDFGIAKLLHDTPWVARTVPGKLIGTPRYMAPEQYGGEGTIDARTDVYALGCVLFEMVCGRAPFPGELVGELINAHRWRPAPPAASFAALPIPLDRLIAEMLGKRPEDRPADMAAVAEALRALLERGGDDTVVQSPAPAGLAHAPRTTRVSRAARAVATAALVVAAAGLAGYFARGVTNAGVVPPPPVTASAAPPVTPAPLPAPPPLSAPAPLNVGPADAPAPVATPPAAVPASGRRRPATRPVRPGARPGSQAELDADGIVEL
jgi:serine/threonine-protein kinase